MEKKYQKFIDWIRVNAPNVYNILKPISEKEFTELINAYGAYLVASAIKDLNNYPNIHKYVYAATTIRSWCDNRLRWLGIDWGFDFEYIDELF